MAKVQTVEVADELKNLQRKALEQSDRFINSVIQGHKSLPSDSRKKVIKKYSLFGFLAPLWRSLTTEQKAVWATAGVHSSLTNWQLFISDNAARLRNDLTLEIPPSELWQVRAGYFLIESPSSELILKQEHPLSYWVANKIVGASWKSELVEITETFSLPLDLEIRYKSDLSLVSGFVAPVTTNTISGTITLSGSPVSGAVVRCVRQSDNIILTQKTTGGDGLYEFTGLATDEVYDVVVEYADGGTKYNAFSLWNRNGQLTDFQLESYTVPNGDNADFTLSEYSFTPAKARYYAKVWTSYQGEDIYTDFEIPFDSVSDWSLETLEISGLRGIIVGYTLFLEISGYRGELLFDNIRAVHGGTNWARDPRCDDISKTFTKGFAIVPPFWVPVSLPTGSQFSTQFPPSL